RAAWPPALWLHHRGARFLADRGARAAPHARHPGCAAAGARDPRREPRGAGAMSPVAATIARTPEDAGRWLRGQLAAPAQLSADSRSIGAGDGFLAIPGERHDGRAHIAQARARGAAAIAYDPVGGARPDVDVPAIAVPGLRRDAGLVAAEYYGRPSSRLRVVAITGTNGKTSCSQWVARGWAGTGRRAGV